MFRCVQTFLSRIIVVSDRLGLATDSGDMFSFIILRTTHHHSFSSSQEKLLSVAGIMIIYL